MVLLGNITPEVYQECRSILEGSNRITDLVIGSYVCPFENVTELDLSKYPKLKTLKIGHNSFRYVKELKLIGLNDLERVVVGKSSFVKEDWSALRSDGHLYLKDCPKLRELKMGRESFYDYAVIEIDNCGMEVIEMGALNEKSWNFQSGSSLELKSILLE